MPNRLDLIPLELLDLVHDFVGRPSLTVAGKLKDNYDFKRLLHDRARGHKEFKFPELDRETQQVICDAFQTRKFEHDLGERREFGEMFNAIRDRIKVVRNHYYTIPNFVFKKQAEHIPFYEIGFDEIVFGIVYDLSKGMHKRNEYTGVLYGRIAFHDDRESCEMSPRSNQTSEYFFNEINLVRCVTRIELGRETARTRALVEERERLAAEIEEMRIDAEANDYDEGDY